MGILRRLFGVKEQPSSNVPAAGDDLNPRYERDLKRRFGLEHGNDGWAFEGGKIVDQMVQQFTRPDISWGVLKQLRDSVPFRGACIVGGQRVVFVLDTSPQPTCFVTGLTASGVSELLALAIKEGAKMTAYRSTWMLTL